MKKSETRELFLNLNKLGSKKGVKFAYCVTKNIGLLKPEMEALDKAIEATPEFKEFDDKRMELVKKFAKKDEKGEPVMKNQTEYEVENIKEFEKEFEKLKEDNQDVFDARTKQSDDFIELLKSESDVTLHKVALQDVPEDITVTEMYSIKDIVDEAVPSPYPAK